MIMSNVCAGDNKPCTGNPCIIIYFTSTKTKHCDRCGLLSVDQCGLNVCHALQCDYTVVILFNMGISE